MCKNVTTSFLRGNSIFRDLPSSSINMSLTFSEIRVFGSRVRNPCSPIHISWISLPPSLMNSRQTRYDFLYRNQGYLPIDKFLSCLSIIASSAFTSAPCSSQKVLYFADLCSQVLVCRNDTFTIQIRTLESERSHQK